MTEEEMEAWEVDVEEWTLDDLELLERGMQPGSSATQLKELLGRLVTNKTAEEIGKIPLRQLRRHVETLVGTINELTIPKENATP